MKVMLILCITGALQTFPKGLIRGREKLVDGVRDELAQYSITKFGEKSLGDKRRLTLGH